MMETLTPAWWEKHIRFANFFYQGKTKTKIPWIFASRAFLNGKKKRQTDHAKPFPSGRARQAYDGHFEEVGQIQEAGYTEVAFYGPKVGHRKDPSTHWIWSFGGFFGGGDI